MTRIRSALALLLPLALAGCRQPGSVSQSFSWEPGDALPEAELVFDRYVDAIGGAEAWGAHRNRYYSGTFSIPQQLITGTVEIWEAPPHSQRTRVEIPGLGLIEEGIDGSVGWASDPAMGPRLKEGSELSQAIWAASFLGDVNHRARYDEVDVVAVTTFEGEQAFHLRAVGQAVAIELYFAVDDGLLLGSQSQLETPMGTLPVQTVYAEYATFVDVLAPALTRVTTMGISQEVRIESMQVDLDPTPDFTPPPVIQQLLSEG